VVCYRLSRLHNKILIKNDHSIWNRASNMSENQAAPPTYLSVEEQPPSYYVLHTFNLSATDNDTPPKYEDVITPEEMLALDQQISPRLSAIQYRDLPDVRRYNSAFIPRQRQPQQNDGAACACLMLAVTFLFVYLFYKFLPDDTYFRNTSYNITKGLKFNKTLHQNG